MYKAFSGGESLEINKSFQNVPDIILIDHRMPSKDGLETTKEILSINPYCKISSVSVDYIAREKGLEFSTVDFLEKPIDFITLFRIIEKNL